MANPYYALRRIRRARSATPSPPSSRFETHREAYKSILTAVHDLAGDDAVDDLSGWIIVRTAHDGVLPSSNTVRRRAVSLLEARGIEVSDGSPLQSA